MSENKFIAKLKGEPTPKSVVEIQNDRLVAPFKSSPMGHIADRDSSVVVAKGAQNWAVNQGQLVPVADDYIGTESDLSGTSRVSGAGLWLNATYTFPATGDETNPVSAIIAPSAKWVLTLCGDSLITQNGSVITLTMLVKIGATHLTTKQFKVRECASQFSQRLAIDFSESEQSVIKAHGGSPLTVQVLCDDEGASATIYSGMTHLTLLQRKIDAELVATDNVLLPEFIENLLEGYIIPADYFSNYEYLEQVEDGGSASPQFTRSGDDMNFSGWLDISSIKNDLDELGDQVSGIKEKIPESASGSNPLVTKQQLATKQDQLTAGDNIIISNNVISATGAGGGAGFDIVVVQELPATGQKGIIYLLAKDGAAPDVYDEYVWIESTQTFELIGTTQVDLSGYLPLSGGTLTGTLNACSIWPYQGNPNYSLGNSSYKWYRTYTNNLNNGADLAVPKLGGTIARTEDIAAIGGDGTVGQVLTKTADGMAWQDAASGGASLPDQTGNAGKFLMTDGSAPKWSGYFGTSLVFDPDNVMAANYTEKSLVAIFPQENSPGLWSVNIFGGKTSTQSVSIGYGSSSNVQAVGILGKAKGSYSSAIGYLSEATAAWAVQLGIGTNSKTKTLQFRDYTVVDVDGNVPLERLTYVTSQIGDISTALETLNGKADTDLGNIPANYDYVVESQLPTADNGYTWYRKYKSGWVEQGGTMTFPVAGTSAATKKITFPIEMADTNYTAQPTPIWSQPDKYYGWALQSKTTTSMTYNGYNTTKISNLSWLVCGMAAQ